MPDRTRTVQRMFRRPISVLTVAAAGVIAVGGTTAASAETASPAHAVAAQTGHPCGTMRQGFIREIRANVRCRTARCVIRRFIRNAQIDPTRTVRGRARCGGRTYRCKSTPTGPEHVRVRCTRGGRFVRATMGP
jgi:hypothetical protein